MGSPLVPQLIGSTLTVTWAPVIHALQTMLVARNILEHCLAETVSDMSRASEFVKFN